MDVVEAFDASRGATCFVGAGGKKTSMARVAARLDRVAVTATVRIPIFDEWVERVVVTDDPVSAVASADGARMRRLKAPDESEPQLPTTARTVVPVVSAHVVGHPLTEERVHRVDRVAELTGRNPGEPITATDVATVLASPEGGRKGVPDGATSVPLVNMVDDAALEATAREIAEEIHARADVPRVVLAEMRAGSVVDIV